jgi:hypothetical protein
LIKILTLVWALSFAGVGLYHLLESWHFLSTMLRPAEVQENPMLPQSDENGKQGQNIE